MTLKWQHTFPSTTYTTKTFNIITEKNKIRNFKFYFIIIIY